MAMGGATYKDGSTATSRPTGMPCAHPSVRLSRKTAGRASRRNARVRSWSRGLKAPEETAMCARC
jgi:hypothetical protein